MILVFGGTTEGRKTIEVLEEAGSPYYYSTRSDSQEVQLLHGQRLSGTMETSDIVAFCQSHGIRLIIDAAHPFAEGLHRNLIAAAEQTDCAIIRYERQYPPHDKRLIWCKDYEEAIRQLETHHVTRLLALSGVNTITKLRPFWQQHTCWFRILNQEASRQSAQRAGFPEDHLVYYEEDDTVTLLHDLHPQAILTKESGESGGFEAKIQAAREAGVRVFVVERPAYPPTLLDTPEVQITCVNGPHGLRLKIQELLPDYFDLHIGLTTGTCATAAAIATLTDQPVVKVRIPDGEDIDVKIDAVNDGTATVIKHAGDDPDLTDGLEIQARVKLQPSDTSDIEIVGGEGVGIVTMPGLGLPINGPAINEVPQRMIRENLRPLLPEGMSAQVTISVPQGRKVGAKTFNPRIGVRDGISIIGTSGIVRPFSAEAWISSIRKEMAVGLAQSAALARDSKTDAHTIVINSGAKSEGFLRRRYPELPLQAFIHYGNFIGETLRTAAELGVKHVVMGLMIGKAIKLAEGHLDTHSHKVTMNTAFILQMAQEAQCSESTLPPIRQLNMARELWTLLSEEEMDRMAHVILHHCRKHCAPLLPNGRLDLLLISDQGRIIEEKA